MADKDTLEYKKLIEKLAKIEESRTAREKYSYKELGWAWFIIPLLFLIITGVILFIQYKYEDGMNSLLFLALIIDGVILGTIMNYNEKWENKSTAKMTVKTNNPDYKFWDNTYIDGYIYTDSSFEVNMYLIAKIVSYLVGIIGIGILALIAFSWLGSITIAPTTIIIILLMVIIHNQEQRK